MGDGNGPVKKDNSALQALVKAESMIQLALILPASVVVGWLMGAGLDRWLHQSWIYLVGLAFGAVAGFVQVIRIAAKANRAGSNQ